MPSPKGFEAEKITLIDFEMLKAQIDASENFDISKVQKYELEKSLKLKLNIEKKLVKIDFALNVKTESKGKNEKEAYGAFFLIFIFHVKNLKNLAVSQGHDQHFLSQTLTNALLTVTYSTSRGILLIKLQGTALQNFVLPIINPKKLLLDK